MSNIDDAGTVFSIDENPGLTLRDWFAGQALQGILGGSGQKYSSYEKASSMAYHYADAMLEARKQRD